MFVNFGEIYTVVKGDTLGKIAKRYKTTVAAIAKDNSIADVNKIEVGQTLKIGESGVTVTPSLPSLSLSMPQLSMPDLSNNMVNYALAGGIVILSIPIILKILKSKREKKP